MKKTVIFSIQLSITEIMLYLENSQKLPTQYALVLVFLFFLLLLLFLFKKKKKSLHTFDYSVYLDPVVV